MASGKGNGVGENGGSEWAQLFADFHARHKDQNGKKLSYTVVFNATMDAFIQCPEVPLLWRVLAWIWRHSWGNSSDYCVDGIGGTFIGQQACAQAFGVDKQRVNDCVAELREFGFLVPQTGHMLYPVDDPGAYNCNGVTKSPPPSGLSTTFSEWCLTEWKSAHPADFEKLESAGETYHRLKKVRLGHWREYVRARTSGRRIIIDSTTTTVSNIEPSSSAFVEPSVPDPPKAEEEESPSDFTTFKTLYPAAHFDGPKAKPLFLRKTKAERQLAIERLRVYRDSPRWQADNGAWIPLASNWLQQAYEAEPPPLVRTSRSPSFDWDENERIIARAKEAEAARTRGAGK